MDRQSSITISMAEPGVAHDPIREAVLGSRDTFFFGQGWTTSPDDPLRTTRTGARTFRNVLDEHAYHFGAFRGNTIVMGHTAVPEIGKRLRFEHYTKQRVPKRLRKDAAELCFWYKL